MLQAGENDAAALLLGKHEVDDIDDAGNRVARIAEKFQANGPGLRRHAVQNPARAGDQSVAALLLDSGKSTQKLIGDVLAQPLLAKAGARYVQSLAAFERLAVGLVVVQFEAGCFSVVDLAHVVVNPGHFKPGRLRRHHTPGRQIVQRSTPQDRLLATRVDRDVAANARCVGRGGVDGKHQAGGLGGVGNALGHHARLAPDGCDRPVHSGEHAQVDFRHGLEFFGVDDRAFPGQRTGSAGVSGATPARDDGQSQFDATLHQTGHFGLRVGRENHEGVLDAPIGRVGHMRDPAQTVELDVVLGAQSAELAQGAAPQIGHLDKGGVEGAHRIPRLNQQLAHHGVALRIQLRRASLFYLAKPVL